MPTRSALAQAPHGECHRMSHHLGLEQPRQVLQKRSVDQDAVGIVGKLSSPDQISKSVMQLMGALALAVTARIHKKTVRPHLTSKSKVHQQKKGDKCQGSVDHHHLVVDSGTEN